MRLAKLTTGFLVRKFRVDSQQGLEREFDIMPEAIEHRKVQVGMLALRKLGRENLCGFVVALAIVIVRLRAH